MRKLLLLGFIALLFLVSTFINANAKPPIRAAFFSVYPNAVGTQLDQLPSNSKHCGVCHFDFNGGGPRNPYGFLVETGRNNGLTSEQAILAIENVDADNDGKTNLTEITSTLYSNTPTFPGLSASNYMTTVNIPLSEIVGYLTPTGATDTTPPLVDLSYPDGGEALQAGTEITVSYTASDASGIDHINVYRSDDSGASFEPVALNQPDTGSFQLFVVNLPGDFSRIKVEAVDNAGNAGSDSSATDFTVLAQTGRVPTTLRDVKMYGTQPHQGKILEDPDATCATCHGNYDTAVEPWYNWKGSMMGQAARDPLFLACLAVAEQDAPSSGDICIRCHSPGGWQEGHSDDTSGAMLNAKDRQGVQCDFCHSIVDFDYVSGISPQPDSVVVAGIDPPLMDYANGSFIMDQQPVRRGPRQDSTAPHDFLYSPFHRSGDLCGTCHNVSNPVYYDDGSHDLVLTAWDQNHPDGRAYSMGQVERTYGEWTQSDYANGGIYAPQFAGTKADGIVSTCQDCHMHDVSGSAAILGSTRPDLALHDLTGGNTFVPDIIPDFFASEVDPAHLEAGKLRARAMLQKAATMEVTPTTTGIKVRVTNQTGHKLPSGYPEGRHMWLQIEAVDSQGTTVFTSGAYDSETGHIEHDAQLKIYEIEGGFSPAIASALSLPAGPSFHFVLNDSTYFDNRIPPRGFTNAAFANVQSPVVGYSYPDGQYWDDTEYVLPAEADSVFVSLYYQSTSPGYIEFLRDENTTNTMGQQLYDAWLAQGKNPPELMEQVRTEVEITATAAEPAMPTIVMLSPNHPNPFGSSTSFSYSLPKTARVELNVYDLRGRKVRSLRNETQNPGRYVVQWDGRDFNGKRLASGVYLLRLRADEQIRTQRVTLMR